MSIPETQEQTTDQATATPANTQAPNATEPPEDDAESQPGTDEPVSFGFKVGKVVNHNLWVRRA